jgi:hypothetical protein
VANAFENKEGQAEISMAFSKLNVFFWWPEKKGKGTAAEQISSDLLKWTIDPKATGMKLPAGDLLAIPRRFPAFSTSAGRFPFVGHRAGSRYPPYHEFARFDAKAGDLERDFAGPKKFTQEWVFIPRSETAERRDEWTLFSQNIFENMASELAIVDSNDLSIKLPIRLRPGLHGKWVDDEGVDGHPGNKWPDFTKISGIFSTSSNPNNAPWKILVFKGTTWGVVLTIFLVKIQLSLVELVSCIFPRQSRRASTARATQPAHLPVVYLVGSQRSIKSTLDGLHSVNPSTSLPVWLQTQHETT